MSRLYIHPFHSVFVENCPFLQKNEDDFLLKKMNSPLSSIQHTPPQCKHVALSPTYTVNLTCPPSITFDPYVDSFIKCIEVKNYAMSISYILFRFSLITMLFQRYLLKEVTFSRSSLVFDRVFCLVLQYQTVILPRRESLVFVCRSHSVKVDAFSLLTSPFFYTIFIPLLAFALRHSSMTQISGSALRADTDLISLS